MVLEPTLLAPVRLRARRRALWLKAVWSADPARDMAITPEEVERHLADGGTMAEAEARYYAADAPAREISRRLAEAEERLQDCGRWRRLRALFGLTEAESDLLMLALAVAADPGFARVCGYLQDDAHACYATPLLAAALFGWRRLPVFGESALARWRLAQVPDGAGHRLAPQSPWVADPYVLAWLLGESGVDPLLQGATERLAPADVARLECLYPQTFRSIAAFVAAMRAVESTPLPPVEIELIAPRGAGKRTLAAQLCAASGTGLLVIDLESLPAGEPPSAHAIERISRALRQSRLDCAVPYWNHAARLDARFRQMLEGQSDLAFFAGDAPGIALPGDRAARQTFHLEGLSGAQRVRLWSRLTPEPMPLSLRDWQLLPADLRAAAQVAPAGAPAALQLARRVLHREPGELFTTLPLPYGWDDIVLAADCRRQLEELMGQARLRNEVLEAWGFGRLCPMGRGINALFAGPSGTGKTMAAQVIARQLDRELCRVDLAEVVNKYIGETEKRLKRVFEICERAPVVLFFDEADALFGQRTQVKDAHDRYANIQIDYLLQRMEQFDGVGILATNRKNDLDSAFLRRLRFIVEFQAPGAPERRALWRLALAGRSPAAEELLQDIAWEWLADKLILTGAEIKAIALAAAFLARADGARIRMHHLAHATRREMAKHGTPWRAGDWSSIPHA